MDGAAVSIMLLQLPLTGSRAIMEHIEKELEFFQSENVAESQNQGNVWEPSGVNQKGNTIDV